MRSGHNHLVRHLVLDPILCHQIDLCDLTTKCQYKIQKRHSSPIHVHGQVNLFHLTFLLLRLSLEIRHSQCPRVGSRSTALQIHWTVLNLRNEQLLMLTTRLHFSLFLIGNWKQCLKMRTLTMVCSADQGCLTCWTAPGLQSKPRCRKANQYWMRILFRLRIPTCLKKLQLEHHHCVRLLKAVYDWLNAARKLYHRVATDLRKRRDEKSLMQPCLWTF